MFVMPEACVGGGALLFDLAATSLSQQCIVYFPEGGSCSALGPGHRLNTGSAAADRAALTALLVAFIPFFSSGARFDVFPRRRTGCSASLLRKGNAAHEERRDRAKRQPQRSTNGHEFSSLSMRHLPTSRRDIGCVSTPTTPFMEELQDRSLGAEIANICL